MNAPDKSLVIWPAVVVDCAAVCTVLPPFSAPAAGSGSEANSDRARCIAASVSAQACTTDMR